MLEIRLLGTFDLRQAGKPIAISSRPAQSLFAYLALNAGTAHRREKLAGLLWPDSLEETARSNLRHVLWQIRKALQPAPSSPYLLANDLTISFDESGPYWLDANVLEEISDVATIEGLTSALVAYQGELLPGFYDEWVILEREHLNALFEHHMARLMSLLQRDGRWLDILDWGERWIKFGQTPEPAYRALMFAHAAKGDMSKVVMTYDRCVKSLGEYGIEPSEQTRLIYEKLKARRENLFEGTPAQPVASAFKQDTPPRTNLPVPLTSFIGREKQVKNIVHLLGNSRLLTLTGAGGAGKTRLAIESANQVMTEFKDGVWWVELVGLADPSLLAQAVAQAVGISEDPDSSLTDTLVEHFRAKRSLLVLDNCEHLILACAQLTDRLLSGCKGLTMLTTSREPLDIPGETTFAVPPLSLPDIQKKNPLESLNEYESIRLFVERAGSVQPEFELSDQNARAISQVCHRLSGMPLAIELAAARVKMMSVDEIAARLDDRFDLLTSGSRMVLPRHQTLKATIDWSYDLLSDAEQIFFHRISVFVGGFTLQAAEEVAVGGSIEKSQGIDLLGRLINKSLVLAGAQIDQTTPETRYGMLESIRDYANEKLGESGEADSVRDRHLLFFMRLAEKAQPEIFLSSQVAWFDLLERELDNLRAAMEWSMTDVVTELPNSETPRQEAGYRLAAALAWFWERGYRREATKRLQSMLAKLSTIQDSPVHATMYSAIGFLYWSEGKFSEAVSFLEKAVSTGRKSGKSLSLAWALNYLGATASAQRDLRAAQSYLEEAFELAMDLGPEGKHVIGWALAFLGDIEFKKNEFEKAESTYEMSVLALGEIGNLNMKAYPLRRLGYLALSRGDLRRARKYFKESLILNHKLQHQLGTTGSIAAFSGLAIAEKDLIRSTKLLGAVDAMLELKSQPMLPSDHSEYSRNLSILRDQLDQRLFKDAWEEGRAMSLEQAVEFSLKLVTRG